MTSDSEVILDYRYTPVREKFAHLDRDEQKYVHSILNRLWLTKKELDPLDPRPLRVKKRSQRLEIAALEWVLDVLMDLEDVED